MGWLSEFGTFTFATSTYDFSNMPTYPSLYDVTIGNVSVNSSNQTFDIGNLRVVMYGGTTETDLWDMENNVGLFGISGGGPLISNSLAVWMDDANELAYPLVLSRWNSYPNEYQRNDLSGGSQQYHRLYELLTESPIQYNWQSVPSISGKNGILLMPTLSDTNNGNPVSGASSSAFIKAPSSANNIRNLVDLSLEPTNTDDAATIFYTIPDGTYTSIKLYGRIGENPKCNNTDDIIEDINQNDTSISVENLECEEYYFCIQAITTDLTLSSNVVSINLSFNWDGSEITILWSGDNNRMTAELIESNGNKHIKFRMYLSDTLIYQFIGQYVDESLSRTVKDINIGFLIDEDNQIGRPSNIYYVSDENDTNYQKYIYNASDETPSDSEMEDIYTWLDANNVVPYEYRDLIDDITHFYYSKPTEIYDYQYTNIGDSGQSYWNHPKSNSYYNNNAQDATQAQWFNENNFVTAFSELDINIKYSSATNRYLLEFTSGAYNDAIYYFGGAQKFYSSAYLGVDGDKVAFLGRYNYNVSLPTSQTFTTLASALNYLHIHFRRCSVYVEGVQWGVRDIGHL